MFNPFHINRWLRGSTLVGNNDQIPDDALRRANNVRLDRTLGQIEARPGWTLINFTTLTTVIWLSKLFASLTNIVSYRQQSTGAITRETDSWAGPVTIATTTQPVSDVNSPDGNAHILKYIVTQNTAIKDDGT